MKRILIVDDEVSVRESLRFILKDQYKILLAETAREALTLFEREGPHLILLDIILPEMDGIAVLKRIRELDTTIPIIMLTATRMVKTAVEAMKLGATDYLSKPFDIEELKLVIEKAITTKDLEQEVKFLRSEITRRYSFKSIIGKSRKMQEVYAKIEQIADTRTSVLITGESGTGKELVARALHFNSSRKEKPFITINCAALPESLIESELFGHERGAFTDAQVRKMGQFELADNGTLFMDEVADLSHTTQAKLLRVLQEKEFTRVGGTRMIRVDVRVITATNKNLHEALKQGNFREDLYYRINVVPIHLPPLRDRKEDLPLLINHFLTKKAEEEGHPPKEISPEAVGLMMNYDWPGNVRELQNIIEQVVTLCSNSVIHSEDLPDFFRKQIKSTTLKEQALSGKISFEHAVTEFERDIIIEALKKTRYIQTHAADLLGISRRILKYKMDLFGIIPPEDK
ncbi:MAG TPA: sigma-54 dependent transcriptional regulator [Nitrospiria bacterium]|nr:sigma-54 dependent transcriptional regulator [Nitrospiria bacterium]